MHLILPVLAGILLALSMPGASFGWLAWIALVPLLLTLRDKSPGEAFKVGFVGGLAFGLLLFYWIYALWDWVNVLTVPAHLGLAAYMGVSWGLFGWGYAQLRDRVPVWTLILALPAIWTVLEFVRSLTLFGFPWGQAADALTIPSLLPFAQVASYTGIWGASFVVILVNVLIFFMIDRRNLAYLGGVAVIALGGFLLGSQTLSNVPHDADGVDVAMFQPSIPQVERSDPANLYVQLGIYQSFFDEIEAQVGDVDLVLLPESALPAFILNQSDLREYFSTWANSNETPILLGTFTSNFDASHNVVRSYNSAVFINADGEVGQPYSKIQLVPFSTEYFPGIEVVKASGLPSLFPMIERLGRLSPGDGFEPLDTSLGSIGTPICFETIFPHISRQFVRNGAQVILTVTNDAWFHNTWALPQHFKKGVYRAIETGRYFVQTANSGISGVISPYGKVEERSRIQDRSVIYGNFSLLDNETFYVRYGDWLPYGALIYLLFLMVISLLRKRDGYSPSPTSSAA